MTADLKSSASPPTTRTWKVKDGIEPFHHILREFKGEDGKMIDQNDIYNVSYIPSKFLVAADGTMIGRFDNPAELDAKLSELFGE